jgi:hypothetical protein
MATSSSNSAYKKQYIKRYLLDSLPCLTLAPHLRPHDDWLGTKELTQSYKNFGHSSVINKLRTLKEKRDYCNKYGDTLSKEAMTTLIEAMNDNHILDMGRQLMVDARAVVWISL